MSFVEFAFTKQGHDFFHNKVWIKLLKIISNAEVVTRFIALFKSLDHKIKVHS